MQSVINPENGLACRKKAGLSTITQDNPQQREGGQRQPSVCWMAQRREYWRVTEEAMSINCVFIRGICLSP